MKFKICRSIISIILSAFMICGILSYAPVKAYGAEMGPDLLITEIMPMSQSGDDEYEFIELYNNSENSINLKGYKFLYPEVDITESKVIPPGGIIVIAMRDSTELDDFNDFYDTNITEDEYMTLPLYRNALDNGEKQNVILMKDYDNVVVIAQYETSNFAVKKSVIYKCPEDGLFMEMLREKQSPTPGYVTSSQIPDKGDRVTGVTLNEDIITLEVNGTKKLVATVIPTTAANKSIVWSSSKSSVAAVNNNGLVTAKSQGTAVITAKTEDGGFTASCVVEVKKVPVKGVTLNKTSLNLDVGDSVRLKVTVNPDNATNKSVTWKSSNSAVASVDSKGLVTAKSEGKAQITVKTADGGYTAYCTVNVNDDDYVPVTGISLNKTSASVYEGKVIVLKATITPQNATNKKVLWTSSNTNVAVVDSNGLVYGKKAGVSKITAKTADRGFSAVCTVTVYDEDYEKTEVKGVRLNRHLIFMKKGESEDIDASVIPDDADNKNVTWVSDNPSAAKVDSKGKVTAVSKGIAVITVRTQEGGYTDRCVVIVGDYGYDLGDKISIWLSKAMISIFEGQTHKLSVNISPRNYKDCKILWSTSNSKVATVSADGKVTGHKKGVAVITASTEDGRYKSSCYVYVYNKNERGKNKGKGWEHFK